MQSLTSTIPSHARFSGPPTAKDIAWLLGEARVRTPVAKRRLASRPNGHFRSTDQVMDALKCAHCTAVLSTDRFHWTMFWSTTAASSMLLGVGLTQLRRLVDAETRVKSSPLLAPKLSLATWSAHRRHYATGALLFSLLTRPGAQSGQTVNVSNSLPDAPIRRRGVDQGAGNDPTDCYPDISSV